MPGNFQLGCLQLGEGEEEGGEPEAAEVGPIGNVADLIADQRIYEWAGIGFGEIETYRIMKSLKVQHSY